MRIAFTILLNNLKMLKRQVEEGILNKFDYWIIVEGAAQNNGSTSWCKPFPSEYHNDGKSIDGTHEYLLELAQSTNKVKVVHRSGLWESKDEQVNQIFSMMQDIDTCTLWEVDIDEFWELDSLKMTEHQLQANKAKAASFLCDYFVGIDEFESHQLIVKGGWGEGNSLRYNRVWRWNKGDKFISHEPPLMTGQTNANTLQLPYRFRHHSYTDYETVKFKDNWYGGHEGILNNWASLNLASKESFPKPLSALLPDKKWDDGKTLIHWVDASYFTLYIQWFKSDNETRNEEIITAIKKNASNKYIEKIVIFAENEFNYDIPKVEVIDLGRRMTYLDCFQHIKLIECNDGYNIIANSDIVITEHTLNKLQYQDLILDNTFIALSRYEYNQGKIGFIGYEMASCSQDTWIFKGKDISLDKFRRSNFYLGLCSCDNIIARVAHDAGMRVINPSIWLKTIHLHESKYRTYAPNSGLHGLIMFINPSDNLEEQPRTILSHSIWEKPIYY
jgi:hypothetical protein